MDPGALYATVTFAIGLLLTGFTHPIIRWLKKQAEKTTGVITDPAPSVCFPELGDSSLNEQLILRTNNYDYAGDVQDRVNSGIVRRLRNEHIEIAFQRVDMNVRGPGVHG